MAHIAASGGAWALAVEILMPIPIFLLGLLSIPLPQCAATCTALSRFCSRGCLIKWFALKFVVTQAASQLPSAAIMHALPLGLQLQWPHRGSSNGS